GRRPPRGAAAPVASRCHPLRRSHRRRPRRQHRRDLHRRDHHRLRPQRELLPDRPCDAAGDDLVPRPHGGAGDESARRQRQDRPDRRSGDERHQCHECPARRDRSDRHHRHERHERRQARRLRRQRPQPHRLLHHRAGELRAGGPNHHRRQGHHHRPRPRAAGGPRPRGAQSLQWVERGIRPRQSHRERRFQRGFQLFPLPDQRARRGAHGLQRFRLHRRPRRAHLPVRDSANYARPARHARAHAHRDDAPVRQRRRGGRDRDRTGPARTRAV
ncbi:MAG: Aldehyde dehydrogenase, partial [uncultured Thermomicrobiales bacterium]